jgi:hypothetical protein
MPSVEDALVNPLFTDHRIVIERGADWLVSRVSGIISIAMFVTFGVCLNRYRTIHRR